MDVTEITRLRALAERCLALAGTFQGGGDAAGLRKIASDSLDQAERLEERTGQQQQQPQPQQPPSKKSPDC